MQRHESRFTELRLSDSNDTAVEIDVRSRQPQDLADAKASAREQSDQRDVGPRTKLANWAKPSSRRHERDDLWLRIDEWHRPPMRRAEQVARRDLRAGLDGGQVTRETTDDFQSASGVERVCSGAAKLPGSFKLLWAKEFANSSSKGRFAIMPPTP